MVQIDNLIHSYGQTSIQYPDWKVEEGKHAMILGNSGCGKTTLLHLLAGLMKSPKGSISIAGEVISEKSNSQLG
jgi:ABC-type sugar transport system ATPase subunit